MKHLQTQFFGYLNVEGISVKQKLLRPIKKIIVSLGLMPKTMQGKKMLKRLVFGKLSKLPFEIDPRDLNHTLPELIDSNQPNTEFKVIYCNAMKSH